MRYHSETTTVYRSAARPRSRPGRPVCRLGGEAVGSAARGAAQVSLARGRRGEPGGRASPANGFGSPAVAVVTASLHVIGRQNLRNWPLVARNWCSLCGGQTANEDAERRSSYAGYFYELEDTRARGHTSERMLVSGHGWCSPFPPPLDRLYIGLDLLDARPHLGRTLGPSLFRICTRMRKTHCFLNSDHFTHQWQCSKFRPSAGPSLRDRFTARKCRSKPIGRARPLAAVQD